ncbi:VPLPA-CTERM sorting domain-containing protein [Paenirhodobacter populi]|uniref:VPLPA-CTERM sorting domain-containing protein n=1 Tax=Paenirhodobacter populi TaxID=2306993 RepID=A0A443JC13_9RHOB|nr:VPLPA-CTERM sorting domain-containing protein [Sinirhodobacter populi]RWR18014.1 hypothetical protein D2T30_17375 [Sinirhodobacter populi]
MKKIAAAIALTCLPALPSVAALSIAFLPVQAAQAATIQASLSATTGLVEHATQEIVRIPIHTTTDSHLSISEQRYATGAWGSGSFSANMSANTTTGEIKADLRLDRTGAPGDVSPGPAISAGLSIAEQFLLTGTGTFTVYALIDASWSFTHSGAFIFELLTYRTENHYDQGRDDFIFDINGTPESVASGAYDAFSKSGSVTDHLLVASVDIRNADNALQSFIFSFVAGLGTMSTAAFLDASHTASFMFATTGDLTATPVTPGFLSNPAILDPLPAVPLPAGAPLILSGLVALFGLRRMKRRAA